MANSTSRESTEKYSTSACGTLSGSSHVELLEGDTASYNCTIFRTLEYNALHSVVQILLHDEAQGTTPMHFYKCFPLRGQVSPIQAVSMGGSPARGLAILLDIHSQEIHFQEAHFLEIVFWSKMSCQRISNPAGYSLSGTLFSKNSLSGN